MTTFSKDDRIEMHPATDLWMQGARYGRVVKVGAKYVHVKLDKVSGVKKISPSLLRKV